jgi:CDP-6-deoxy-D-xylo-4-hexulose-3-dehydrase
MKFNWPLAVSPFTLRDRLKIARRIVSCDRYTMGEKVEEFEHRMSDLSGRLALGVCSGSCANQLLFEFWKIRNAGEKAVVIAPAVTWLTSVSPTIMAGFEVRFCDINLKDFSFDYEKLEAMLKKLRGRRVIIWPTALIGRCPDMECLSHLAEHYKAELFLDACENTLSFLRGQSILASCPITTTSCYFSHQVVAIEFGFIFFRDARDYNIAKMFRNHGLTRSLQPHIAIRKEIEGAHLDVDPQFLFGVNGTNIRPSEIHAMFGLIDLPRAGAASLHRNKLYARFRSHLTSVGGGVHPFIVPPLGKFDNAYCLPIFTTDRYCGEVKKALVASGAEARPIVGGNLLRQPALRGYGHPADFPNAEWVHKRGFYLGLHKGVTEAMIDRLASFLTQKHWVRRP